MLSMRAASFLVCHSVLTSSLAFAWQPDASTQIPPFRLQWMNHAEENTFYNSNDHAQAVFIVEAYFRACPYCNDNVPHIESIADHFADNSNVQVLDVSRDCRSSDYVSWIQTHRPNHPVLNDCQRAVLTPLAITGYPTTVILDCNLNVIRKFVGLMSAATKQTIISTVQTMLSEGCTKNP